MQWMLPLRHLNVADLFELQRVKACHYFCSLDDTPSDVFVDDAGSENFTESIEVIIIVQTMIVEKN